jgi:hypothetical protein
VSKELLYLIAADAIIFIHVVLVAFIILGLLLIYVGMFRNWWWVRNIWFRVAHLLCVGIVVLQSWLGIICPLTVWEMAFREKAGDAVYSGSFVAHWLESLLYYRAPDWFFVIVYTVFGALVLASWFVVRPRQFSVAS